jgi:hypothetical protein
MPGVEGVLMAGTKGHSGGARPGSGRKRGSRNKHTLLAELLPRLEEAHQELLLYGLLRRIADDTLDDRYRDVLRIACLPFLHPRPRSDLTAKPAFMMSDEELKQTRAAEIEHEKQLRLGRGHLHLVKGPK